MNSRSIDKKDSEILEILKNDCRKSYSDIGEEVGLSRVAVKNRMELLEKKQIIKGYRAVIDSENSSNGIEFFMDIEVNPEKYGDVIEGLSQNPIVMRIVGTTGESRLHVTGLAPDRAAMEKYTDRLYYQLGGIRRISIHTAYSVLYDREAGVEYDPDRGEY